MTPNEPAIPLQTLKRVFHAFGVPPPRSLRPLRGGASQAEKFVAEIPGEGDGPPTRLFLKRRERARTSVEQLLAQHAVIRHLAADGLPVREPHRTADGGTLLLSESSVFELFPFVEADPWAASAPRAQRGGALLAHLHASAARIALPPKALRVTPGLLGGPGSPFSPDTPVNAAPGTETGYLHDAIREATDRLGPLTPAPLAVVHGDYHPGNTRWRGDEPVGVLDFDSCRVGTAAQEAALAAVHFSLDRSSGPMQGRAPWPDPDLYEAFWRGYTAVAAVCGRPRLLPWVSAGAFAEEILGGLGGGSFDAETIRFATGVVSWLIDHAEGLGEIIARIPEQPANPKNG